jgi:hypothetical protein
MLAPPAESAFPVARCSPCGREVVVQVTLDVADRERRSCIHCDAELDPAEVRWVGEVELGELGYAIQGEGCGREGCGNGGRCGR